MKSDANDHILIRHQPFNKLSPKISKLQNIGYTHFFIYSLKYLNIIMLIYWLLVKIVLSYIPSFICVVLCVFILLINGYCIIIHPMISNIMILGENLLTGWCRMRIRPARLVSFAFLYTTHGF